MKFIAIQRHALTEEQIQEINKLGFNETKYTEIVMKPDKEELRRTLQTLGLVESDAISFVAPALITCRLIEVAKELRLRVFLPDSKADPARRVKTEFPPMNDELKEFVKKNLSNAIYVQPDGQLYVWGQMPFNHVKYVEV